jgi:hypothetical protein
MRENSGNGFIALLSPCAVKHLEPISFFLLLLSFSVRWLVACAFPERQKGGGNKIGLQRMSFFPRPTFFKEIPQRKIKFFSLWSAPLFCAFSSELC